MERHVNLLGTLATLWGALAMLVGVSMLLLAAGALAELLAPVANRVDFAASLTAAVFVATNVDFPFATQSNAPWCRFTDFPVCVPSPRLGFLEEVRGRIVWDGLKHASVLAFLPEHGRYAESLQRFRSAFAPLGAVTIPSWWMTEPTA